MYPWQIRENPNSDRQIAPHAGHGVSAFKELTNNALADQTIGADNQNALRFCLWIYFVGHRQFSNI